MTRHRRVTFSQGIEVINYSLQHLRQIHTILEGLESALEDERAQMMWTIVLSQQTEVLNGIERFVNDADPRVLRNYVQYSVELPEEVVGPPAPVSSLTLVRWLTEANQPLINTFKEQAESAELPEAQEAFGGLWRQVDSLNRKLSKEYQRFEDL